LVEKKKEGTRETCLSVLRAYSEFTGMAAEQLIKESDEEMKLIGLYQETWDGYLKMLEGKPVERNRWYK